MLGLADRSDEVVTGTTEREWSKLVLSLACLPASKVMPHTRSVRGVPWKRNPAEAVEGEP